MNKHFNKIFYKLPFRLFGVGSILELENKTEIGSIDYTFYSNQFGSGYYVYPIYHLSEVDLKKITNNNVIKIRIETDLDELDKKIKNRKLTDGIVKSLNLIKERLVIKKDVYTDF